MGKGDKRTQKGKRWKGTFGKHRPKKTSTTSTVKSTTTVAKKTTAKKTTAKKTKATE